jgi:hypothetical protein
MARFGHVGSGILSEVCALNVCHCAFWHNGAASAGLATRVRPYYPAPAGVLADVLQKGASMRQRAAGLCLVVASLFLVGTGSAAAQDATVSANYDIIYHEFEETSFIGVHVDAAKSFGRIAAVGEIGFNHLESRTDTSFAGGGRYVIPHSAGSRIQPAVQVLLGLWRCGACDVKRPFIQPGLLVDIPSSDRFRIRVQFDVRRIFFDFGGENAQRLSVGGVWSF